ncbi:MAG: RnfABCDGE type electron transport complex subunit B [Burkholderiales bacterium]
MSARLPSSAIADEIDALLPQTQCRKCGYAGCRPYAEAVAAGTAEPNQCPPGGDEGAADIAAVVGIEPRPVDPRYGTPAPPAIALIDEALCIGCTLCIQACPVDAIVGAAKLMHTVIASACTGCELCIPPCPVDCIAMLQAPERDASAKRAAAVAARRRFEARGRRLRLNEERVPKATAQREALAQRKKQATVAKAMERARQRLAARSRES